MALLIGHSRVAKLGRSETTPFQQTSQTSTSFASPDSSFASLSGQPTAPKFVFASENPASSSSLAPADQDESKLALWQSNQLSIPSTESSSLFRTPNGSASTALSLPSTNESLHLRVFGFTNVKQRQLAIHNVRRLAPQIGDVKLPQKPPVFQLSSPESTAITSEQRDELHGGNWFDIECPDVLTAQQILSLNATVLSSSMSEPFMIGVHRIVLLYLAQFLRFILKLILPSRRNLMLSRLNLHRNPEGHQQMSSKLAVPIICSERPRCVVSERICACDCYRHS